MRLFGRRPSERGLMMLAQGVGPGLTAMAALAVGTLLLIDGMASTRPNRSAHEAFLASANAIAETSAMWSADSNTASRVQGLSSASASSTANDPLGDTFTNSMTAVASGNILVITGTSSATGQSSTATLHVPIAAQNLPPGTITKSQPSYPTWP